MYLPHTFSSSPFTFNETSFRSTPSKTRGEEQPVGSDEMQLISQGFSSNSAELNIDSTYTYFMRCSDKTNTLKKDT